MSLGGPTDEETLDQAVAYALARGAILVAAAGNAGTSTPFYPAAIPGVISVAASDQSDRLYAWSSFGDTVDVAAPGCNPAPSSTGGYVQFCGTSSATPVVAGLVALMLSLRPAAAREAVIAAIDSTALPIADRIRHGRIDAAAALAAFAGATPSSPSTAPASNAEQSSTRTLRGRLSRSVSARTYRRSIEGALTTAILRFTGQRVLTLAIRGRTGAILARVRGRSPLRLVHELPPGAYDFVISGRRAKAAFSLVYAARVHRP
jgi:subtilisin family serine protease